MVDISEALESEYLSVDYVKNSPTKKLIIVDPGSYQDTDYGRRLTLKVNIDGKIKIWRPNRDTIEALSSFGKDTINWLSKLIKLTVEKRQGRELVIGRPEQGELPPKQETVTETPTPTTEINPS